MLARIRAIIKNNRLFLLDMDRASQIDRERRDGVANLGSMAVVSRGLLTHGANSLGHHCGGVESRINSFDAEGGERSLSTGRILRVFCACPKIIPVVPAELRP